MLIESGDINAAVDFGRDCMAEIEKAGLAGSDEHLRLGAIYMFALFGRGDTLSATEVVESLIEVADRVGTSRARGSVYWNAAIVAHRRGSVDEALRLTDRAVALLGEEEDSRDLPRLRMNYAWLLLHQETPDAIRALAELTGPRARCAAPSWRWASSTPPAGAPTSASGSTTTPPSTPPARCRCSAPPSTSTGPRR